MNCPEGLNSITTFSSSDWVLVPASIVPDQLVKFCSSDSVGIVPVPETLYRRLLTRVNVRFAEPVLNRTGSLSIPEFQYSSTIPVVTSPVAYTFKFDEYELLW